MKKAMSVAKVALLVCTLLVVGLSAFPQAAEAARITITCDGSNNLCATYEDPDVIIEFWLGRATSVLIEFDRAS